MIFSTTRNKIVYKIKPIELKSAVEIENRSIVVEWRGRETEKRRKRIEHHRTWHLFTRVKIKKLFIITDVVVAARRLRGSNNTGAGVCAFDVVYIF